MQVSELMVVECSKFPPTRKSKDGNKAKESRVSGPGLHHGQSPSTSLKHSRHTLIGCERKRPQAALTH